jgi:hypothetical protein
VITITCLYLKLLVFVIGVIFLIFLEILYSSANRFNPYPANVEYMVSTYQC